MASSKNNVLLLGVPAVRQVTARLGKGDSEEQHLIEKLGKSCRKFDRTGKGSLSVDDFYNVIKLQNGINISKDEVRDGCDSNLFSRK